MRGTIKSVKNHANLFRVRARKAQYLQTHEMKELANFKCLQFPH